MEHILEMLPVSCIQHVISIWINVYVFSADWVNKLLLLFLLVAHQGSCQQFTLNVPQVSNEGTLVTVTCYSSPVV